MNTPGEAYMNIIYYHECVLMGEEKNHEIYSAEVSTAIKAS